MAAVLACGAGALLSHRSAAARWGIAPSGSERIEVTTTARGRSGPDRVTVHRSRALHPEDRAVRDGIPVTSVARTLLDLAEVVGPLRLERAFEAAERLRLLDLAAVQRLLERSRGRRGVRPLNALVAEYSGGEVPDTRSPLEDRFLAFCRAYGLPPPAVNVAVAGFDVDAWWPGSRLAVELDSYTYHGTRAAFERDRARDAALQLAGYRVLRVTDRRLSKERGELATTIRSLVG
jgi:Protein of unknown function (DUF559)